jgi:hypothetical protein
VAGDGVPPCGGVGGGPLGEERDMYGVWPATALRDGDIDLMECKSE